MRYGLLIGLALLLLAACTPKEDPFFGRWTVDKVNVDFNEEGATPEMVRQYGAMEKDNIVLITPDSLLMFVMDGDTVQCRCSLRDGQILCDGDPWGTFEDGVIKTETSTPIGQVKVSYKKSNQ